MRVPIQTRKAQLATLLPHVAPTATVAITLVWAFRDGGYPTTSWYPAGVLVGCLLIAQILGRSLHVGWDVQTAAVGSVFAFATVELASILWASSKGAAWDSANRTFTYGFIFLMFAGWRSSERAKHLLALLLIAGLTAIGIWTLHSAAQTPGTAFLFGRLALPTGYANASAALFLIPFWPAVALAADRTRAVLFRAFALGCAASLAAVAFVPESRGALYAFPVVVVVLLVLARNRLRTSLALIVALAPTAYFIHTLSKPYSAVGLAAETHAANQAAVAAILAGVFAALLGAAVALADQRFEFTLPPWYRYVRIAALCARRRSSDRAGRHAQPARGRRQRLDVVSRTRGERRGRRDPPARKSRQQPLRLLARRAGNGEAPSVAGRRGRQLQRGVPATSPLGGAAAVPAQSRDERALTDRSDRQPGVSPVRLVGRGGRCSSQTRSRELLGTRRRLRDGLRLLADPRLR